MQAWTVQVIPFPKWEGYGERPVCHYWVEAPDADTAIAITARLEWQGQRIVPDGAEVTALPRFM